METKKENQKYERNFFKPGEYKPTDVDKVANSEWYKEKLKWARTKQEKNRRLKEIDQKTLDTIITI